MGNTGFNLLTQHLLGEIAMRYEVETQPERPEDPPSISCPDDVRRLLGPEMAPLARQQLRVLLLNTKNLVVGQRVVYQGNANSSMIRPAEVPSSLIGKEVQIRLYADWVEVYYKGHLVERMERARGEREARVDCRHIIGSLVRKPGAFARYRFREQIPTMTFRDNYGVHGGQRPGPAAGGQ